jgi:hypothetical protein
VEVASSREDGKGRSKVVIEVVVIGEEARGGW